MSSPMYPAPRPRIYTTGQLMMLTALVLVIIGSSGVLFYSAVTSQIAASTTSSQEIETAIAQATSFARVTAAAYAIPNPYPPNSGTLVFNDPLNDNSQGHNWQVAATQGNNACQFANKAYQSANDNPSTSPYSGTVCFAQNTEFSDFTFQVQTILVQGLCDGIIFRGDSKANNFDRFEICSNAWYDFRQCSSSYCDVVFANGLSSAINTALGSSNTLGVVASGSTITIYVNGKQVVSATESGFTQGEIGLVTSGYNSTLTIATFRNARVWT